MVMYKVYESFKFLFTCLICIIDIRKNIVVHIKIISLPLPASFVVVKLKWYSLRVMSLISVWKLEDHQGQLPST